MRGERNIPRNVAYQHEFQWSENNAYSHLRASVLGPSLVIPLADRRLTLGEYQQLVLVDFDNRSRTRQIILHIMGE